MPRAVYPQQPHCGWQFVEHEHHITLYQYRTDGTTCVRYTYDPSVRTWLIDCQKARRPKHPVYSQELHHHAWALLTVAGLPNGAPFHIPLAAPLQANRRDLLFRVLREDEHWRNGLTAKDPAAVYKPNYHVSGTHPTQSISFMSADVAGWSLPTIEASLISYIHGSIGYTGRQQTSYTIVVVEASAVYMPVVIAHDVVLNNSRTCSMAAKWHEKIVDTFVPARAIRGSVVATNPTELRVGLRAAWDACVPR